MGDIAVTWADINLEVITRDEWDRRVSEAEKWRKLAGKLHEKIYETGNYGLERAYRRTMLRYMAEVISLTCAAPSYIEKLQETVVDRMHFMERKLEALMQLERRGHWTDHLYRQFESTLRKYELLHDQAIALGWDPLRPEPPQARHPCCKDNGLCRLAESQQLSSCVYEPESCRWRVNR